MAAQPKAQNTAVVNFEGLADVIRQLNPATNNHREPVALALPVATPARHLPPPKMTMDDFCWKFELSANIKEKLFRINITGPHLLRLIDNLALRTEAGLDLGELAGVRDAEERWMAGIGVQG
jgi:hypothetical protein